MFGKVTAQGFSHAIGRVRHGLMGAYNTGRKMATALDQGMDILSRVHRAVKPLTDQTDIGRQVDATLQKGMGEYGKAKGRVVQKHREIEDTVGRVRAAAPELF